jgi:hypothetical protein
VDGRARAVHLKPGPELEKARREVAAYEQFRDLVGQVTEVNEAICVACPAGLGAGSGDLSGTGGEKGGLSAGLAQEKAAELGRLAAGAARVLGCGGPGLGRAGGGGRVRPWAPQHNCLQRVKVTHHGTKKKWPA